jgi:hypothetical protein
MALQPRRVYLGQRFRHVSKIHVNEIDPILTTASVLTFTLQL